MKYEIFQYEGVDVRIEDPFIVGEQKVALNPIISQNLLTDSFSPIMKIAKKLIDKATEYGPNEVTIEFGVNVGFEGGNLCWGIAKGSTSTHLNITMTWKM